ncbi:MAG TPA: sigma-70 family RNA polymerase sigma factor [Gemmataceae bacterium]|nr:sigma-70 family RNA polymerase sigma factor [Gemmataceae bacterium]
MDRSDADLLRSFVERRDEAAFEALVRRHGPMVRAVCGRILRDAHDADDAFQATFVVLVRRAAAVERKESLASWLHGVALRTSRKARVGAAHRRKHERRAVRMPIVEEESNVVWRDLRPILDEEIQRLPEPYRGLVVLCYLEGKSYAQAACRLGCSRGTVSTRLTKARSLLRERLVGRGLTLSAVGLGFLLARRAAAAAVPAPLVLAVLRIAGGVATTARVAALAQGVLKAMSMTRLKTALLFLLLTTIGAGGVGAAWQHLYAAEAPPAAAADEPYDCRTAEVRVFEGHTDRVAWVAFSPDGKRALSASFDATVRVWDVETGKELHCLQGHTDRSDCAVFSPDGKRILSCSWDGTVRLWDVETGKELKCFGATGRPGIHIARLAFFPDGKRFLCVATDNDSLQIRDMETGDVVKDFGRHNGHIYPVALSSDGSQVLEATYDENLPMRLWDVESGKLVREFKDHPQKMGGVALSPDGRLALSTGGGEPIRLWDTATGREIHELTGHRNGAAGVAFSPDGRYALSGGGDQTVRLWHVGTGKELCCLFGHLDYVDCVAFSPDGRFALSGGGDKTVRLWRLPK